MVEGRLRNWAGNVVFGAGRVHRPESVDELRRIVARGRRVRALGSGHSFSLVADSDGELVRLDGLPPMVEIDSGRSSVTVAAGMRYADVAAELYRKGLALPNMASLPHISVAGSCATGTHGSGDGLPCLSASVSALELVGPEGDLVELRREGGADVFSGVVVALGALGVVTRVTLDVEPAFEVAQRVRVEVPLEELGAGFDEVFGAAYSVSAFTDWRSGVARVWLKCRTDVPAPVWAGGSAASEPVHPVPGMVPAACTVQMGVPGPWHERLPHFRPEVTPSAGRELQSEWFLPRDAAAEAFEAVRAIADVVAPVLHISEVRTVRGDDLWLSPAYGRDSVTLHFTWHDDPAGVLPVVAELQKRLVPLGARPHWGKLSTTPGKEVIAGYERGDDFARLARRSDPGGKFRNAFVDALLRPGG
ncbi:FAD-binding protein [Actinomadura madurae]|uniref:FAD-binding protein n=1 Tax=Actinomadura madurae TaxID=1993 RepID=UPI0020D25372|nr:FAD-binding protein [Actinomadura madurae]MCP9954067.1 FAD-binding protein [Actinomadura madurae]MCP9970811.1 FAD-binding protein [Actinomadura madurae]MCP9983290.1 FAD-binding protein [Actinomadura madurae]MCQ0005148.1 FAD-binding protein [Actinomadura madurae]MCQ0019538.1 FAD-binding protein [Actinomadura madurae]